MCVTRPQSWPRKEVSKSKNLGKTGKEPSLFSWKLSGPWGFWNIRNWLVLWFWFLKSTRNQPVLWFWFFEKPGTGGSLEIQTTTQYFEYPTGIFRHEAKIEFHTTVRSSKIQCTRQFIGFRYSPIHSNYGLQQRLYTDVKCSVAGPFYLCGCRCSDIVLRLCNRTHLAHGCKM